MIGRLHVATGLGVGSGRGRVRAANTPSCYGVSRMSAGSAVRVGEALQAQDTDYVAMGLPAGSGHRKSRRVDDPVVQLESAGHGRRSHCGDGPDDGGERCRGRGVDGGTYRGIAQSSKLGTAGHTDGGSGAKQGGKVDIPSR